MSNYDQLVQDLHGHVLEVIFRKEDGSMRTMRCTLSKNIVPPFQLKPQDDMVSWTYDQTIEYCGDIPEKWMQYISETMGKEVPTIQGFGVLVTAIIDGTKRAIKEREGKKSLIKVWDINAKGWRSFHIESVISSQVVETI
jgi:hypothetical protein